MRKLIITSLAALASSAALAMPSGFLEVSNLKYEVTDLRPDDGIEANVLVAGNFLSLYAARWGVSGADLIDSQYGVDQGAASVATNYGYGKASYDGNAYRTEVSYEAESLNTSAFLFNYFRLDPGARVTFSFDWIGSNGFAEEPGFRFLSVGSWAEVYTSIANQDSIYSYASLGSSNQLESGTMSITLESGDDYLSGYLSMQSRTGSAYVSPPADSVDVAEPSAVGLMLAGLAGLAALRRRTLPRARLAATL